MGCCILLELDWDFQHLKNSHHLHRQLIDQNKKMNSKAVRQLPLVISCGGKKQTDDHPAYEMYTKGLWQMFRSASPSIPNLDYDVWVLSAKYGLIPYNKIISPYDKIIVSDSKRKLEPNERRASDVAKQIENQWKGKKEVLFVGGKNYVEALEKAGFKVHQLTKLSDFPGKSTMEGSGKQRSAIKWYLTKLLPKDYFVIKALKKRFEDQEKFLLRFESRYKQFQPLATDPTIGSKKGKKKLKKREFQYYPYKESTNIIEEYFRQQSLLINDLIPIREIIALYIGERESMLPYNYSDDDEFIQSDYYWSKEHLIEWYNIPTTKADGTPIYDRWGVVVFLYRILSEKDHLGYAAQEFLLSQKQAKILALCGCKMDKANKDFCKSASKIDFKKLKKELSNKLDKTQRTMNRYTAWEKINQNEIIKSIGIEKYIFTWDFLARFFSGKEDRIVLAPISKEQAVSFVQDHHSALPKANTKGLMITIGAFDTDGHLGAVGLANTPTGRWDLSHRPNLDSRNVVELTRIASDGSIKGASSLITSRIMDLLPSLRRGNKSKNSLFITYSLDNEDGTTYLALRDKGLVPVEYIRGRKPSGKRKKGKEEISLSNIDKIRWEYGSAKGEANWKLLDLVGKIKTNPSSINKENLQKAIEDQSTKIGKKIGKSLYLHRSALCSTLKDFLDKLLKNKNITYNVVRIKPDESRFSLLYYPTFFSEAFPKLQQSYTIELDPYTVVERYYNPDNNPPILHRKELLLKRSHPKFMAFAATSKKALDLGLLEDKKNMGNQKQWEQILRKKEVEIRGNQLIHHSSLSFSNHSDL